MSFPQTADYLGLNAPVRAEVEIRDLEVEGIVPREIDGAFFRAVPDPAHPPLSDDTALSGDGMISSFRIENGHVDYAIRYVETERYLAERKARRALFGRYRNPYTDDPSVAGLDRTVANTTPVWHAGRLLMTKEDGLAYEVDPVTLKTIGRFDFDGALKSETMTAHPRIDPVTGEMFFFGYQASGLCSNDVAYCVADASGKLVSEQHFATPYGALMHDFAITERHAIFVVTPTTNDLDRLKQGGAHWTHDPDRESWIGIMPRYGSVESLRWVEGPAGVSVFHVMNAFEQPNDLIHVDIHLTDTNPFPFIREASGIDRPQWEIGGGLIRWTIDLAKPDGALEIRELGPPGDLPVVRDVDQGRPHRVAWYLSVDPNGPPPIPGGPIGTTFSCLLRIEPGNGRIDMLSLPAGHALNEPVHVPAADGGGWLLTVVDRQVGEDQFASELWVLDADDINAPPVAKVKIPVRLRPQVHGCWVPAAALHAATERASGRKLS